MLNAHVAFTLFFFGTEAVIPERFFGDTDEYNLEYTHRGFLRITTCLTMYFCLFCNSPKQISLYHDD